MASSDVSSWHVPSDELGESSEPENSSSGDSAANTIVKIDKEMVKLATNQESQLDLYVFIEKWARLSNAGLTPQENHILRSVGNDVPPAVAKDLKKVADFFGKATGASSNATRCIKHYAEKHNFAPGDMAHVGSIIFTLCKALCIAERAGLPVLAEDGTCTSCSCMAETYCMPMGCDHKRRKLTKDIWLPSTLCSECSKCLRCQKLLGFKYCFWSRWCECFAVVGTWMLFVVPLLPATHQSQSKALQSCSQKGVWCRGLPGEGECKFAVHLPIHLRAVWFMEALLFAVVQTLELDYGASSLMG